MSKPTVTFTTEENRVIIRVDGNYTVSQYTIAMTQAGYGLDELAAILAGATLMGAVGLWDDRVRLRPWPCSPKAAPNSKSNWYRRRP